MAALILVWCDLVCSEMTLHMRYEWKFLWLQCMLWVKRIGFQKSWNVIAIRNKCFTWMLTSKNQVIPLNGVPCFELSDVFWILVLRLKDSEEGERTGDEPGWGEDSVTNCYDLTLVCWSFWKFSVKRPCAFVIVDVNH